MPDLLRLPLRAVDLATRPTRFVIGKLLDLRHTGEDQPEAAQAPAAEAPAPPKPAARPKPKPEPPQSAKPKPRAKPKPAPKAARRAARQEPTKGEVGEIRLKEHMAEQDAGGAGGSGVGATLDVQPPWDDYDAMTEDQVLERLTGADPALRAIVRLYEGSHGERRQIMIATEEVSVEP